MNKNKLFLVLQREFLAIVAKKSFLLVTLLMPLLFVAIGAVPVMLQQFNSSDVRVVGVIDDSEGYGKSLSDNDDFCFIDVAVSSTNDLKDYKADGGGEIYAFVVVPKNVEKSNQVNIYSENPVKITLINHIEDCLEKSLTDARIKSYGIEGLADIIDKCNIDVDVKSHTWDEEGDKVSSTELAMGIGIGLSFLTYMFVLMYGAMIMSSVVEDKTNRIVEVIVSSCRPMELMLGKIMGIALVGLTQIAIWAILITGITALIGIFGFDVSSPVASPGMPAVPTTGANEVWEAIMGVNWVQLIGVFVLYFIGGYLLYASLFAGFGSAVDQQSDANQFTTPIMIVIIIALYAGMACMDNPDGQLAVWCSMIPFTSPIVMMIRLPYHIPFWEVIISLVVLYGTAVLFTWIASRIYRTGILMYGRKVSFGEILRWIKK